LFQLVESSVIALKEVSGCGSLTKDCPTMAGIKPTTSQYFRLIDLAKMERN
jgi:hypothetical protein